MRFIKNLLIVSAAMFTAAFLQACFSDSNADSKDSGMSKAEVEALLAPLEQRIAALESASGAARPNVLVANGSNSAMMAKATADGSGQPVNEICTVLDYTPSEFFPGRMSAASCKSSTGFLLTMPITTKAEEVRPAMLDDARIFFETVDCSGPGYVHLNQIGDMGFSQGAVFGLMSNATFYTPANPTIHENLRIASMLDPSTPPSGSRCAPISTELNGIEILSNDPAVTGIQNTYTGPITMF